MITTTLPGFSDPVHDAQRTFKGLLEAIAHPGQIYAPKVNIAPPPGLTPLCAAACLTLFDLETPVWLQPDFTEADKTWLRFHTGCRFSEHPQTAMFALIRDAFLLPDLTTFNLGSAEDPEKSTTVLIQVEDFISGMPQQLSGPGILERVAIAPVLPTSFWSQWPNNHSAYPQGIDCFLFSANAVMGLPRTARLCSFH